MSTKRVVAASQMSWEWTTGPLAEGDYRVRATLQQDGKAIDIIANRFSVIAETDTRLATIRTLISNPRLSTADTKDLTRQAIMKMISNGDADRIAESDMPFHTLLHDYEFLRDEKVTRSESYSRNVRIVLIGYNLGGERADNMFDFNPPIQLPWGHW